MSNPDNRLNTSVRSKDTARFFLVLPAAGSGIRMNSDEPKQYTIVNGLPLLQHTLLRVATYSRFTRVVLVLAPDDERWPLVESQLPISLREKLLIVTGGIQRMNSVNNALLALASEANGNDWVLVHDVVRPCLHATDIEHLIVNLHGESTGGLLAVPVRETLKESDSHQMVKSTVDRTGLWLAATPQMFRYSVLQHGLQTAIDNGLQVTDEAAAVEALGLPVKLVQGRADNIKVTYPEDLALVAVLLEAALLAQCSSASINEN